MPEIQSVGFIGLGAMGLPMAEQLLQKLPPSIPLHVYDVVPTGIDKLAKHEAAPGRVHARDNSKAVTDSCVSPRESSAPSTRIGLIASRMSFW